MADKQRQMISVIDGNGDMVRTMLNKHRCTVDVHLQRLRKKLDNAPDNQRFITTVAGMGYKYMADDLEEISREAQTQIISPYC